MSVPAVTTCNCSATVLGVKLRWTQLQDLAAMGLFPEHRVEERRSLRSVTTSATCRDLHTRLCRQGSPRQVAQDDELADLRHLPAPDQPQWHLQHEVAPGHGGSQKTAWHVLQRIRKAFDDSDDDGPVEFDETYMGGKAKNMHVHQRAKLTGRGGADKTAVGRGQGPGYQSGPCLDRIRHQQAHPTPLRVRACHREGHVRVRGQRLLRRRTRRKMMKLRTCRRLLRRFGACGPLPVHISEESGDLQGQVHARPDLAHVGVDDRLQDGLGISGVTDTASIFCLFTVGLLHNADPLGT